jgi:hypothetical protein
VRKANETNEEEGRQNAEAKTVEPPKPPDCAFGRKPVIYLFLEECGALLGRRHDGDSTRFLPP